MFKNLEQELNDLKLFTEALSNNMGDNNNGGSNISE